MIPRIFISSTIADLHYLRDGLRDAIEELSYQPVMSDYGEVGYLNPTTAAESCYVSVRQCQMVILIIGSRYGSTGEDGLSVTHKEFLAAKEDQIPIISFVEQKVLNYKEVFQADPKAAIWTSFQPMDNPYRTFQLLDEITASKSYNATIPFTSAGDAKKKLKLQVADFVGQRLSQTLPAMSTQLKDVLAEITTVRNLLVHGSRELPAREDETKRYLAVARFLLEDRAAEYRDLLQYVFGDLDVAMSQIMNLPTFPDVIMAAGYTFEVLADDDPSSAIGVGFGDDVPPEKRVVHSSHGSEGWLMIFRNKHMKISRQRFDKLSALQHALRKRAGIVSTG